MRWIHKPESHPACQWFFVADTDEVPVMWICFIGGKYVVDGWQLEPPPNGPYQTLREAKFAVEVTYA